MAKNNKKKTDIVELKMGPIQSTDDIVNRGIWHGAIIHESAINRLPPLKRLASRLLTDILGGHLIIKGSRAPAFPGEGDKAVEREPEYIYPKLLLLSKVHWLLRTIQRARIGEVLTPRWDIDPRFRKKCSNCGKEYDNPNIETCDVCDGTDFKKPEPTQYDDFRRLIGLERNSKSLTGEGRTFKEFLYSTLWYKIALNDFYWEIGHVREFDPDTKIVKRVPRTIRVLDSSITFPVMDDYGNFTSTQYFCPVCYKQQRLENKGKDTYYDLSIQQRDVDPDNPKCPICGEPLTRTAYWQKLDGKVVARFGKDEVIHSSTGRIDPEMFGTTEIVAAVKLLYCIDYFDERNLQMNSHGHGDLLLGIEGADRAKAEEISEHIQMQIGKRTKHDSRTGETEVSLEPVMIIIGLEQGKKIHQVDITPKFAEMQSIEFYRLYVEKVAGLFGVTPIFANTAESAKESQPNRIYMDVQNRVTRQDMSDIEDPFNDFLLPHLGITDWVLRFGKIESRDELRDKQIILTNAQAIALLIDKGFDVDVAEDGRSFTTSSKPVREPMPSSRLGEGKIPQDLDGAPQRTMPSGRGGGVPIQEPEVSEE